MGRLRIGLVIAATLLMGVVAAGGPASAGGPTSVLLSVPGESRTASLYYTDHDYFLLSQFMDPESPLGRGTVDERAGAMRSVRRSMSRG